MPDHVIATSQLSSSPAPSPWTLLEEFATIGDRRNATTAACLTSAGGTVELTFELVDPPGISPWFANFSGHMERECKRRPHVLNAAGSLVLLRMCVFPEDGGRVVDYFVYNAGVPGKKPPSIELIPGPYPKTYNPMQIGILPCGGGGGGEGGEEHEHYAVVFPAMRGFEARRDYDMHVFSSEKREWRTKTAAVAEDRETGLYDYDVLLHKPSKAAVIPAGAGGGSSSLLAWVDLWRGVLLCNVLDADPVLRVLRWPVPPPRGACVELHDARSIRDAAVTVTADGGEVVTIRFVELRFDDDDDHGGDRGCAWTATVWDREVGSEYEGWCKCFEADIAGILADDSRFSDLTSKVWDDEVGRRGLTKVVSAPI